MLSVGSSPSVWGAMLAHRVLPGIFIYFASSRIHYITLLSALQTFFMRSGKWKIMGNYIATGIS
jgi:hypothetical protein